MSATDAILGIIAADGEALDLRGVTNFAGFDVTPLNDANGQPAGWTFTPKAIDLASPGAVIGVLPAANAAAPLIDHGSTGATETIDFTLGPCHKAVVDQAATITLIKAARDGAICSFVLSFTGPYALAWAVTGGAFRWLGTPPTLDKTGLLQVVSCMTVGTDILAQATPAG